MKEKDEKESKNFRFALGSCHDIRKIPKEEKLALVEGAEGLSIEELPLSDIWNKILARQPDAFLWLGDIMYADFLPKGIEFWRVFYKDFEYLKQKFPPFYPSNFTYHSDRFTETKTLPSYQRFLGAIGKENVDGMWDDHDFGLNDEGRLYPGKTWSQTALLDFFDIPEDSPRRKQEGVYYSKHYFDGKIKVIFLDNRYFKDPPGQKGGDLLGDVQWKYLESEVDSLKEEKLVIVASGLQILPTSPFRTFVGENWYNYEQSRNRLLSLFLSTETPVILTSGDVHFGEISVASCGNLVLPELTTSGMTHAWTTYPKRMQTLFKVQDYLFPSPWAYEPPFLNRNFGEIVFDEEKDLVTINLIGADGVIAETRDFALESMRGVSSAECVPVRPDLMKAEKYRLVVFYLCCLFGVFNVLLLCSKASRCCYGCIRGSSQKHKPKTE
eukprot:maker-scaffold_3-snap-gene-0.46-mRNA-1 protein AED:0.00 eAED:0.00 QI:80/1/1/1/0/0.5/2/63/439